MKTLLIFSLWVWTVVTAPAGAIGAQKEAVLNWTAPTADPGILYTVYRTSGPCPAVFNVTTATKVASALTLTTYSDTSVNVATSYCYAVTATLNGVESAASNLALATIPMPPPIGLNAVGQVSVAP